MCYSEWLACQLRNRVNEARTYCHISPRNSSLVSLRLIGIQMEWFTSHRRGKAWWWGGIRMCVLVLRGSTNETMFSQHNKSVKERIGQAQSFDFTLEIQSPWTKLRKPPRSNFQCLSQLIHHGVIAVSLLSRLWAADEPQLKASVRIPYLQRRPREAVFVCVCLHQYIKYLCSLPRISMCMFSICVFVCTLDMFAWLLQDSFITPTHGRHLSRTALEKEKKTQSQN